MPANGQYTQSDLTLAEPSLGWPKGYLKPRAARAWWAFKAWLKITYMIVATFNEGYRPLATQVYYWNLYLAGQGNPAARPGNSKHGDAEAIDLDWPFTSWKTSEQAAWRANEAAAGWSSSQGVIDDEPWHKVNTGEPIPTMVAAIDGVTIITNQIRKRKKMNFWRDLAGSIYYGNYGIPNMTVYNLLVRYDTGVNTTFNAAEVDMLKVAFRANGMPG